MVRKGDTLKDVITLLKFRKEHLSLELQKVPFTTPRKNRENGIRKLKGRIKELDHLLGIMNADIRSTAKYEWRKVQYLRKLKVENIRKEVKS